jgi:hypothetical protein
LNSLFIVLWLKTDTTRLRRWLSRAWQATHKGTQDAAEFGAVEMGKSFVWIQQPVVFEQRQRRLRLYGFRVVAIQFLVFGEDGWHPDVGRFFGGRQWVKVRSVAVAWCSHGFVSFPTLTSPISFGWIVTLYATSEIPG